MRILASLLFAAAVLAAAGAQADTAAWQAELDRARTAGQGGVSPQEDAAGAVDGKVTGKFSFHTGQDENPFWQVDLGEIQRRGRVAVYNPHVPERLAGFKLLLSDDGTQWREAYRHDDTPPVGAGEGAPFIVPLAGERGRFVRIQVPGRMWMHLDEVQVFATDGETNLARGKPATQSSTSRWSTRSVRVDAGQGRAGEAELARRALDPVLRPLGAEQRQFREELDALIATETPFDDPRWATLYGRAMAACQSRAAVRHGLERFDPRAMRMAIDDMASTFPERFADAATHLARLSAIEARLPALREALAAGAEGSLAESEAVLECQREVLLGNPLLDFDKPLFIRRNLGGGAPSAMSGAIGVAANFHANDAVRPRGWDNEIAVISGLRGTPQMTTLYKPDGGRIVADLKLDFDAERLMFASVGQQGNAWRIFEIGANGEGLVQVTPDEGGDVSHSDPCYLPDGRVIFASTATYVGLPCVFGSAPMVALYRMDRATGKIRQLTFEPAL